MSDGEWLVIETLSDSPTVVAAGSRVRKWRPLSNVFRGSSLTMVQKLVGVVVDNLKDSQSLVDLTPGTRLAYARPILGPGRQVHALMVWLGSRDENPPAPPRALGWSWDVTDPGRPSTVSHPGSADFYGFPPGTEPTLTDLLSTLTDLRDTAEVLTAVDTAEPDHAGTGEWLMRRPDGRMMKLRYAFRAARLDGRLYLHGICQELPDHIPGPADLLAVDVLGAVAADRPTALVHTKSGHVRAWLTPPPDSLPSDVISGDAPLSGILPVSLPGLPESTALGVWEFRSRRQ
ncbi:GAF domain-containing protein [Nocardia sp. NPDC020380]|uniref:GAF domain-containing protein n=1 Tax=Nocardia sp. NPDC020380 TaxID=3364309 RepID=UPI00379B544C